MPAPEPDDIAFVPGEHYPAPANNTDPQVGTKSTTDILVDLEMNAVINFPPAGTDDEAYYGGFYIENLATGHVQNARVFSRTACFVNPIAGQITIGVDRADDAGKFVFIWGKVGGTIQTEYVELPSSGTVTSTKTWDAESVKFYEVVNAAKVHVFPVGVLTISQSGVVLSVIRGTGVNPPGQDLAVSQAIAFIKLALATAKDTDIELDDRKTPPSSGISAFAEANRWTGQDNSLAVPGNELLGGESVCVIVEAEMPAYFPSTHYGGFQLAVNLIGSAVPEA